MSSDNKNNYITGFVIFLSAFLLMVLAFTKFNVLKTVDTANPADTLTAEEFFALGHEPGVEILDLRTPEEYRISHLGGVSNINFYDTLNLISQIDKLDRDKQYLIYCRTDRRSGSTFAMMKEKGFKNVHLLKGGILAWILDERPLIKEPLK